MVMQSVAKSGAVSIIPKISPAPVAAASPDSSPLQAGTSVHLSYSLVNPDGVDAGGFFGLGIEMKDGDKTVFFYEIKAAEAAPPTRLPSSDRAFVASDDSVLYIEASRAITQINKESLTTLLDLADEAGCTSVHACISKSAVGLKDIVRSYGACGFSVGAELGDFIVMTFDI